MSKHRRVRAVVADRSWWLHPYGVGFYALGAVVLFIKSFMWAFNV